MKCAELIKSKRKKMRYSRQRMSEIIGVSRSALYQWEIGKSVPNSARVVAKIEIALGLKYGELYSMLTKDIEERGLLGLMCSYEEHLQKKE